MITKISMGDKSKIDDDTISGRRHEGKRINRWTTNDELHQETQDQYKHKAKKRKAKLKSKVREAIPRSVNIDQHSGSPRNVNVKRKIWLGRRERDGAPKKGRLIPGH